jgi:hypothetical protein
MNKSSAAKETLINSANEMKHEAHGMQQPRHINKIGEGASTAQRSDSLVQPINQRFPKLVKETVPFFNTHARIGFELIFPQAKSNLASKVKEVCGRIRT